ncbi:hypothetical protein RYZ59_22655, partial [Citrobacter sp. HN-141]|uniref:hypothetical protein n=1 Tax=unclassified Citrobacter TaxID=2644389 RepID=UPI002964A284
NSGAQRRLRFVQVILGQQRQAVCIDNLCHKIFLLGYYARLACVIQVIVINQLNFTIFFNLNN